MATLRTTLSPVRYALGSSPLGAVIVGAGEEGIRAILLGDDPAALVHELQGRFPWATPSAPGTEPDHMMSRIVRLIEAPGDGLDLPLEPRGTAFQRRVWRELRTIPVGTTASYTDIARRIGAPAAARAVARACASNPLAVAVPCHRVVRSDGRMAGYRWGIERKRALLAREALA